MQPNSKHTALEAMPRLRTAAEARDYVKGLGLSIAAFAKFRGVSAKACYALLNEYGPGLSGKTLDAAIALGMQRPHGHVTGVCPWCNQLVDHQMVNGSAPE